MPVNYQGEKITLVEAYRNAVLRLIQNLQGGTPASFTPFVFQGSNSALKRNGTPQAEAQ